MTTMHDDDGHEYDDDDNDGDDDDHDIYGHDHDISLTWLTAGWSSAHTYDYGFCIFLHMGPISSKHSLHSNSNSPSLTKKIRRWLSGTSPKDPDLVHPVQLNHWSRPKP